MGGSGRFATQKETYNSYVTKELNIQLSPAAGYFFADKFAGGLRGKVIYEKVEFNGGVSNSTQLGIGPFLRYYFLNTENRFNLFAESAYQYMYSSRNYGAGIDRSNDFTLSVGPVIYLNETLGIEGAINGELYNYVGASIRSITFFFSLGFQIHLEKENSQ